MTAKMCLLGGQLVKSGQLLPLLLHRACSGQFLPPENSPTASERAEGSLQLQNFLQIAASDSAADCECWSVRGRLVKREEPSLIRSGVKPPGDGHFWPIFAGADGEVVNPVARGLSLKRDAPYRMLDAPFSGVGIDDGAEGECRLCGLR